METPTERKSFIFKFLFFINLLFSITTIGVNFIGLLLTYDLIALNFNFEGVILGMIMWFFLGLYQLIFMIALFFYWSFFSVQMKNIYIIYWVFIMLAAMILLSFIYNSSQITEDSWIFLFLVTLVPLTLCVIINGNMALTVIEKPDLKDS